MTNAFRNQAQFDIGHLPIQSVLSWLQLQSGCHRKGLDPIQTTAIVLMPIEKNSTQTDGPIIL